MKFRYTLMIMLLVGLTVFSHASSPIGNKHSGLSQYMSYHGLVMSGYQGWFRTPDDGSGEGWRHYGHRGTFDNNNITIDLWPDVSEYEKTYETPFKNEDGSKARVFSSWDKSTVDLHFNWMEEYGVDGVFMQRFFGVTRTPESRSQGNVILGNALQASRENNRAIAVMYDLSGLRPGENISSVIEDWKQLVDDLKLTAGGNDQTYLYHNGRPLVAIWGLGFPDRPYNIRDIEIERLIYFLKDDPEYGGCAVMLGVPAYFRTLSVDCLPDDYLHTVIKKADIVMPWTVQRFTPLLHADKERYYEHVKADLEWCKKNGVDYAPCVYPGFSWYNLSKVEFDGSHPISQIPRQQGRFYWNLIHSALTAGSKMLYVAMFDEIDEATAIFKSTNKAPVEVGDVKFLDFDGVPSDHYLWLTGKAAEYLKAGKPVPADIPMRESR